MRTHCCSASIGRRCARTCERASTCRAGASGGLAVESSHRNSVLRFFAQPERFASRTMRCRRFVGISNGSGRGRNLSCAECRIEIAVAVGICYFLWTTRIRGVGRVGNSLTLLVRRLYRSASAVSRAAAGQPTEAGNAYRADSEKSRQTGPSGTVTSTACQSS